MRKLQNTLYITTQGSYLHKERETLVVEQERKKVAQLPVHSIGHIFCFGNVLLRRAQHRVSEQNPVPIAHNIIAAKIRASRKRARVCVLSGRCMCRRRNWASAACWIWWKWIRKQAV